MRGKPGVGGILVPGSYFATKEPLLPLTWTGGSLTHCCGIYSFLTPHDDGMAVVLSLLISVSWSLKKS